jgi:hypothetical protein
MSAILIDRELILAADILDDIERVRIANTNRLFIMTRSTDELDSDGGNRGFGYDKESENVISLTSMVDGLAALEVEAEKNLTKAMKRHPLGKWVKSQKGLGEKQAARLLAAIGDPYWHLNDDRPRTVAELWAYSGLHALPVDPENVTRNGPSAPGEHYAPKRRKGVQANWSTKAKTRAYLIATSCLKQLVKPCAKSEEGAVEHVYGCSCSPYRVTYDVRRARTAVSHPDWTPGHSHNDALRISSKEILKGFYNAAKEIHEAQ